jgi:hypothetical protein
MMQDDYLRRAFAAWFRGGALEQPSNTSEVVRIDGRLYVVLRNQGGVMAVYRVRNDGMLKRLRRWPKRVV